tara:strand:+ start:8905 stop:10803 length:1899 start_codon:yes stop_codon:yes gene_type:complete
MQSPKDATKATCKAHDHVRAHLPPASDEDFANSTRGFIATIPDARIVNAAGNPVWEMTSFAFEDEETAPDTINPSLWRQAKLNKIHGLFKVTERIYQVRNFDISNITFIEGDKGYIIIDPLISSETARAGLELMRAHRGDKPVTGVIYTHSHVDHYGGMKGVMSDEEIAKGEIPIIAPEGFLKEAVSENVLAGVAMGRRATYMYGALLPRGPKGHVDSGLGKTVSLGQVSLVPPNVHIQKTGDKLVVDGVEIIFQMTPDTEAPAEMNFYFPQMKALCMAENCSCHMHNIYTPRGAQVRDAKSWSYYIHEAIELYGEKTDVLFASHHWPRWGSDTAIAFLKKQRDMYKYVHDQTLRFANHGLTPIEIAEEIALPPTLAEEWYSRGYYGTLNHNAKAVYQRYLGWFDGNPANLHKLPPVEAGKRYVELAGGPDKLLAQVRAAFDKGDYRWAAEIGNHLVFADPSNADARHIQADALEQMGYQAESGPWRGFYLTAAMELRNPRGPATGPGLAGAGQVRELPIEQLLDSLSVRLNGPKAGASYMAFNLTLTDTKDRYLLTLENAVLHHFKDRTDKNADASIEIARNEFAQMVLGEKTLEELVAAGKAKLSGNGKKMDELVALFDYFNFWFEIAMP